MAKGDSQRSQNMIDSQEGGMISNLNNETNTAQSTLTPMLSGFQSNYNTGVANDMGLFNSTLGDYNTMIQGLQGNGGADAGLGGFSGIGTGPGSAYAGFQNFANTGGFSGSDISDLRSRAISPTQSIAAQTQQNLNRNLATSGYSPNYAAASALTSRNEGYGIAQDDINANASIAQAIQSGKLSGLQGMSSIDEENAALGNQSSIARMNAMLGAIGGKTSLYGTTPGQANTFGQELLTGQGLQNQLSLGNIGARNQIGLGLIGGQNQKAQIPGDFQQFMGNLGSILGPLGGFLGGFGGFGGPSEAGSMGGGGGG